MLIINYVIAGEGYGNRSWIEMQLNNLTRFESTVFQSVLEKIAPYANPPHTGIDIDYSMNMPY